ncbi:hypothetical protein ACET3X_003628 [Alternaria dauci]|uniref:AAA+ ATPase domain-containing protein n=1 Tax=Alternaria dauci TaxID=48095 RepID=A0ABR3USZ8_9PLEO
MDFGVLSRGQDSWILKYMNSEFYEIARNSIKERTRGRDIHVAIIACAALNVARVQIPVVLDALLNQVKWQVTSSIVIDGYDIQFCNGLLKLVREKSEESRKLRRFRGEHEVRTRYGRLSPLAGKMHSSFWHDGTHFTLDIQRPKTAHKNKGTGNTERVDNSELFRLDAPGSTSITVRCWGHSREPITELFKYIEKRISESKKLNDVELQANARMDRNFDRPKRPLSTIDLEPKMMQDIIDDVELFFHKDSQDWYQNSGRPYRHGYLLTGPPGSGKSSLLAGIASHANVPLFLVNLQGMDDNDLKEAFNRIPFWSCVALEDIDCVGADVGNRGAQKPKPQSQPRNESSECAKPPKDAPLNPVEALMTKFIQKQATASEMVLDQVKAINSATLDYLGEAEDFETDKYRKGTSSLKKHMTLSGLLNAIDGVSATESKLIIMTTNHPEKLDPALYRAGRVERTCEISYATKASAIMTFKRLFDLDIRKRFTSDAIDRFAQAFQAQFPSKSRITTAELAKYCGQYRGKPDVAVKEFADWLQRGADKFTCSINYSKIVNEEGVYNVPEPFDEELLRVSTDDLIDPDAATASGTDVASKTQTTHRKFGFWNPLKALNKLLLDSGEYVDLECIEDSLSGNIDLPASPLGMSSIQTPLQSLDLVPEFTDADFDDDFGDDLEPLLKNHDSTAEASPTPLEESLWDEAHHNQASPVRSITSVKFSEPGKLALASPRPITEDLTVPEQGRNDSGFDDPSVDGSDTDEFNTAEEYPSSSTP